MEELEKFIERLKRHLDQLHCTEGYWFDILEDGQVDAPWYVIEDAIREVWRSG